MKQYSFGYGDGHSLRIKLKEFRTKNIPASRMLFFIYSEVLEGEAFAEVCAEIEEQFPGAEYFGCSTSGNIVGCELAPSISVVCNVFEEDSTQFEVHAYPNCGTTTKITAERIAADAAQCPWLKVIEMYFTIPKGSFSSFCSGLDGLPKHIKLIGGVSCSGDITSDECCIYSREFGLIRHGVIAVFYGGEDLHAETIKITGWKPLKRVFKVTNSDGNILKELDGIPAYNVYSKYLGIENGDNFFYNTLEFPLFYEHNGTTILRVPVSANDDGSIIMSSDIDKGSIVRLSYGDPQTVVDSIGEESTSIREFCPDVLHIFSCAARRAFWDRNEPTYELTPFRDIAASAGFFSHGEFIREKGHLNQHNVTLAIVALREGVKIGSVVGMRPSDRNAISLSKIPLVSRLARFIAESTKELEEAVITDGLTGLYNRREIESRIARQFEMSEGREFCVIMFDIDNFKRVNDTYGHQTGDTVIRALASLIIADNGSGGFSGGRWGGEEFMLLLPDTNVNAAAEVAEMIRAQFEAHRYPDIPSQTISVGVTQARESDTVDILCNRVDEALYKAKQSGKNMVVIE